MTLRSKNDLHTVSRAQPWLGTIVEIRAGGARPEKLAAAVKRAFGAVARVHRLMSFHDAASDVSRLNREAANGPVTVDLWTWRVLAEAQALHSASEGSFDITVAPLLMKWGYLPSLNKHDPRQKDFKFGKASDIELLEKNRVRFRQPLVIDLGGIAKGFAVDMAIAELRASGVACAVVNAGGDLRVFGGQPETVHVRHPDAPGTMVRLLELDNAALATSAHYFTEKKWRGRRVSPLIDARRGQPCRFEGSVSVMAPTCLVADALTKVVMTGEEKSRELLARFQAQAFLLTGAAAPAHKKGAPDAL